MNQSHSNRPLLLGCGILKKEIRHLIALNNWQLDTFFLDSMLHVDFDALARSLENALTKHSSSRRLVFYGACHPLMDKLLQETGVSRTPGQNCVEMLLGEELFTHELANGAYFLLEDWALRWDYMIHKTFGSNDMITKAIFREGHSNLLCLRTPCSKDFSSQAELAGKRVGLPLRWLDVSLDNLHNCLLDFISAETGV